jgi:hypothetical protein
MAVTPQLLSAEIEIDEPEANPGRPTVSTNELFLFERRSFLPDINLSYDWCLILRMPPLCGQELNADTFSNSINAHQVFDLFFID